MRRPPIYGLMAEFDTPEELLRAAQAARDDGYTCMDAFSPAPVEGLGEAVGFRKHRVPRIVLIGGILGGLGGFYLQVWINTVAYPLNVGGRPWFSWPSFIPVTFEMTILFSAFAAVIGMLALNGLPLPYHPAFNVPAFSRASQDGFFLLIESLDPRFDGNATRSFLAAHGAKEVAEVAQ